MRSHNWYRPDGAVVEPLAEGKWKDICRERERPGADAWMEAFSVRHGLIVAPNSCAVAAVMAAFAAQRGFYDE